MPKQNREKLILTPDIPCALTLSEMRWGAGQRGDYLMLVVNVDQGQNDYQAGERVWFAENPNDTEQALMNLGVAVKQLRAGKPNYEVRATPHLRLTKTASTVTIERLDAPAATGRNTGSGEVGGALAQAVTEWEIVAEEVKSAAILAVDAFSRALNCKPDDIDQAALARVINGLLINVRERDFAGIKGLAEQLYLRRQRRDVRNGLGITTVGAGGSGGTPRATATKPPEEPLSEMPRALVAADEDDDLPF
jgi:hypothetical protein